MTKKQSTNSWSLSPVAEAAFKAACAQDTDRPLRLFDWEAIAQAAILAGSDHVRCADLMQRASAAMDTESDRWKRTSQVLSETVQTVAAEALDAHEAKAKIVEAAKALVDALPKCDECSNTATRAFMRGKGRWCDEHRSRFVESIGMYRAAPEYPRAVPLRALLALLAAPPSDVVELRGGVADE